MAQLVPIGSPTRPALVAAVSERVSAAAREGRQAARDAVPSQPRRIPGRLSRRRGPARRSQGPLFRAIRRGQAHPHRAPQRTPTTMIRRRAAAAGGNSPFYFDKPGFSAGVRAGAGGTGDQQVPRLKLRSGIRLHRRSLLSSNAVHDSEGGETMKPTDLASYPHTERDLPLPKTTKETILASQPPGNAGNIG
jgi:hypothetical protein